MKYAIYDKAADGYLTKLEFENDVPVQTLGLICGYNEYITEAKLLDTKEEAVAVVTRIESNKFMEKGRFVIHSFDEKLADQYIISETGNPTKVVDSITVDLDGSINVKYGTMLTHWSTKFLEYAINRMNALQKAKSPKYTAWCNTFDIYKVITVTDERSCTHYQFINVTAKGLEEYAKDEEEKLLVAGNEIVNATTLLNKRIEELEKANYDLGEQVTARGIIANRLQEENDKLKTKVESIKKETRDWKNLYESADEQRTILKDVIDTIYTDLKSETICNDLKDTLRLLEHNPDFDHIYMPTKVSCTLDNKDFLTAKDEMRSIINNMITIIKSRDLNQRIAFSSAEEAAKAKDIAEKIIDICDSNDDFDVQLYKFSKLYETIDDISKITNSSFTMAFNKFLALMSTTNKSLDKILGDNINTIIKWRALSEKLRNDLEDQKKLNDANKATIAQMVVEKRAMNKEIKELRDTRGSIAEVMFAIRNAICNNNGGAFDCIESSMVCDSIFNSTPFMAGVRENIKDICTAEKRNIANHDLKNGEISKLSEKIEKLKGQLNSMYGYSIMITGSRCCGKQVMADILSGKKIPVDKKKYDDLVEYVSNINLTYDNIFCMMDKPVYLSTITESLNDLTK